MSGKEIPKALTMGAIKEIGDLGVKSKKEDQDIILQAIFVKDMLVEKPDGKIKYK
jgi:hypothetical protein